MRADVAGRMGVQQQQLGAVMHYLHSAIVGVGSLALLIIVWGTFVLTAATCMRCTL